MIVRNLPFLCWCRLIWWFQIPWHLLNNRPESVALWTRRYASRCRPDCELPWWDEWEDGPDRFWSHFSDSVHQCSTNDQRILNKWGINEWNRQTDWTGPIANTYLPSWDRLSGFLPVRPGWNPWEICWSPFSGNWLSLVCRAFQRFSSSLWHLSSAFCSLPFQVPVLIVIYQQMKSFKLNLKGDFKAQNLQWYPRRLVSICFWALFWRRPHWRSDWSRSCRRMCDMFHSRKVSLSPKWTQHPVPRVCDRPVVRIES